ncbi:MAG TPA: cobaltochelatase subunit CobT, partial [Maritimibacter sp.]|nr:cobaltochelatase subunit CobT [Maritimibacter sp.]
MSKTSDNPADPFKKALAEATKVLANDTELNVTYTVDPSGTSGDTMRLPQVTRRMTQEEVLLARGTADALAMRRKFHDGPTHARFAPSGDMARAIYEAMETARCEAMGARVMPGTASNIDHKIADEAVRKGYLGITQQTDAPLAEAAGYFVRQAATGRDLPPGASHVLDLWRDFIEGQAGATMEDLQDKLSDQTEFARFTRRVIEDLGYGDQLGDDPDYDDEDQDEAEEDDQEQEEEQGEEEASDDQDDDEGATAEQEQEQEQDESEAQVSMDELADDEMGDEAEMPEADAPLDPPPPPPASEADPNYTVYLDT